MGGCKGDSAPAADEGSGVEDLTIVVEQDKSRILEEEEQLKKRRETFEAERQRLESERTDVAQKIASLSKKDRKQRQRLEQAQAQIVAQQDKLRSQMGKFEGERDKLAREKTKLLERIATLTQTKGGLTLEQREQIIAQRERDVAHREGQLASREKDLAQREADLVKRLDQADRIVAGLQAGAGARPIVSAPAPAPAAPGAPAPTRTSALKQQRDVRTLMQNKGVLADDLPPGVRDLDGAAEQALRAKDYQGASDALSSLQAALEGVAINQAFVQAKMTRINQMYQGAMSKLDESQQKRVLGLLDDVSDSFSDGRYDRANRKINQIYAVLQGAR